MAEPEVVDGLTQYPTPVGLAEAGLRKIFHAGTVETSSLKPADATDNTESRQQIHGMSRDCSSSRADSEVGTVETSQKNPVELIVSTAS